MFSLLIQIFVAILYVSVIKMNPPTRFHRPHTYTDHSEAPPFKSIR